MQSGVLTMTEYRYASIPTPGRLVLATAERPEVAPNEVVVDITYCGICATDTHAYSQGGLPPAVFGHEWTGTIAAIGSEVEGFEVGQRVVASVGPPCGSCPQCKAGHADNCDVAFAEANGVTPDSPAHGGFAEVLAVPARRVAPVLEGLTDEQAGLVEPAAVTFHAVKRAKLELGAFVVVQGAGPIGLLTAQHARHAGAGRVAVVEPNEARRESARNLGFTEVFDSGAAFNDYVFESSHGMGADVLFECTGVASLFQPSAELVRRGGTLALVGFPAESSQVSYPDWQQRELTVIGSLAYNHEDFTGAMRAIQAGGVNVTAMHTGTIGLDELEAMFHELESGSSKHGKVLVDPRR